jgi:TetR/AcrR family transcriptional regulator, transcriptional repressor for nem operon
MSKSQVTRQKIVHEAALLFNQQGFAGASMADIMRVTGLQKGGIYNHFGSKEALALEAFDYLIGQITQHYMDAIRSRRNAIERLLAMLEVYRRLGDHPLGKGGCPILNTAVESDDTHPALRQRARSAMESWHSLIQRLLRKGIERGEISTSADADAAATIIIATIEGALMMSKLYGDDRFLAQAIAHLQAYLNGLRA